jgi:hypothetical protein
VQSHVIIRKGIQADALRRHVGPLEAAARAAADVEKATAAVILVAEPEEVAEKEAVVGDALLERSLLREALAPIGQLAAVLAPSGRLQPGCNPSQDGGRSAVLEDDGSSGVSGDDGSAWASGDACSSEASGDGGSSALSSPTWAQPAGFIFPTTS